MSDWSQVKEIRCTRYSPILNIVQYLNRRSRETQVQFIDLNGTFLPVLVHCETWKSSVIPYTWSSFSTFSFKSVLYWFFPFEKRTKVSLHTIRINTTKDLRDYHLTIKYASKRKRPLPFEVGSARNYSTCTLPTVRHLRSHFVQNLDPTESRVRHRDLGTIKGRWRRKQSR